MKQKVRLHKKTNSLFAVIPAPFIHSFIHSSRSQMTYELFALGETRFLFTGKLLSPTLQGGSFLSKYKISSIDEKPNLQEHCNRLRSYLRKEKLKFLRNQSHQQAISKNSHCLSGGKNL